MTNREPNHKITANNSRQAFGLNILKNNHPAIRKLQRESETTIHGNKFWGSSYLLMDYFKDDPIADEAVVMDIGCGWGLGGIYLAKQYNAHVRAVDADENVFPYLHLHAEINNVEVETVKKRFEQIKVKDLEDVDELIGADICFWDELTDEVYKLIKRAIKANVSRIVIADPEREPFFNLAERCIEEFHAELYNWDADEPRRSVGCLLVIENA